MNKYNQQKKLKNKTTNYQQHKSYKSIIEKRYVFLMIIIIVLISILIISLFYVQIIKHNEYLLKVEALTNNVILGSSAPRGRIYDRNGKILVDNEAIKTIVYKKQSGVTLDEEIKMAYFLANLIEVNYSSLSKYHLKNFWIKNNSDEANEKITAEEWKKLSERKLSSDDIFNLKMERITDKELSIYKEIDKEAAYI